MVAARLGRRALTRHERVEGHRERWEDVVARRALIVARHRPETIGRTSRTHGTCGTVADRAWWPRRRCAVDAGASAGLKEASHIDEGRGWSAGLETPRRGLSDSTVGLVPRVPSRMCWVRVLCCGISFLGRLGAGDASVLCCGVEARSCWRRGGPRMHQNQTESTRLFCV